MAAHSLLGRSWRLLERSWGSCWAPGGSILEIIGLVFAKLGFSIAFCVAIILFGSTDGVLRANALSKLPPTSVMTPDYP